MWYYDLSSVIGLAWIGVQCATKGFSINEDYGDFGSARVRTLYLCK